MEIGGRNFEPGRIVSALPRNRTCAAQALMSDLARLGHWVHVAANPAGPAGLSGYSNPLCPVFA
jgi:hypothetical protein